MKANQISASIPFSALFKTEKIDLYSKRKPLLLDTDNIAIAEPAPKGAGGDKNTSLKVKRGSSAAIIIPMPLNKFLSKIEKETGERIPSIDYKA